MSEAKPPAPEADKLAERLQVSLAQQRPRPWKIILGSFALGIVFLALLTWYLLPTARPEVLQVLALDALFTSEETPMAHALLLLPSGEQNRRRLRGQTLVFQPGEKLLEISEQSNEQGHAEVAWTMPPRAKNSAFLVRYVNVADRQQSLHDAGQVYVLPKEEPLFVVDADETLIAEQPNEQACTTLLKAAQEGWQVVYLALAHSQADPFRNARGWIQIQAKLPPGPVLGRAHYPSAETAEQARRQVLKSLHDRFRGRFAVVVKDSSTAVVCKELGIRNIIVIGNAVQPAEVLHVATWADVPVRMK